MKVHPTHNSKQRVSMILPLFHGHPDKRFTIAIRGERDDPEKGSNEDRAQAV